MNRPIEHDLIRPVFRWLSLRSTLFASTHVGADRGGGLVHAIWRAIHWPADFGVYINVAVQLQLAYW
jgi:hypothetical protein